VVSLDPPCEPHRCADRSHQNGESKWGATASVNGEVMFETRVRTMEWCISNLAVRRPTEPPRQSGVIPMNVARRNGSGGDAFHRDHSFAAARRTPKDLVDCTRS